MVSYVGVAFEVLQMKVKEGANLSKPVISVFWSRLQPIDDNSIFRRECPFCQEGILPVTRDTTTLVILPTDRCLYCGQRVNYLDIDEIRKFDGGVKT